jgi:hypothetical protein
MVPRDQISPVMHDLSSRLEKSHEIFDKRPKQPRRKGMTDCHVDGDGQECGFDANE